MCFVPDELIIAADGISVGLCAGAEFGFEEAEKLLPRNTCSLIKSFFGFKLNKVCPYIEASDMVVGETTCDGKRKAYEIFKGIQPNLYVMEVPQMKSSIDRELLKAEYNRFKAELEKLTGVTIDAERLKKEALLRLIAGARPFTACRTSELPIRFPSPDWTHCLSTRWLFMITHSVLPNLSIISATKLRIEL